jgi:hypothetical protein
MASAAVILAALAGLALPAMAMTAPATASIGLDPPGGNKPSPKCRPKPLCPTDTPTPTPTGPDPQPSTVASSDAPPGGGPPPGPGVPAPGGQSGPSRPGMAPGGPAGTSVTTSRGQMPAGAVGTADPTDPAAVGQDGRAQPAGPTSLVSAARPIWPILWGGTLLIAVVTAGLLLTLRDKPNRPAPAEPVGPVDEPDQTVPSPRGPIRMEWTEPPG